MKPEHYQLLDTGEKIASKIGAMRWLAKHRNPVTGPDQSERSHQIVSKGTRNNSAALANSDAPQEVRHVLIDYRNGNEHLAAKPMTRKKAFGLNARLKGSGFAWAALTGY